jgi:hypothetical protein
MKKNPNKRKSEVAYRFMAIKRVTYKNGSIYQNGAILKIAQNFDRSKIYGEMACHKKLK